MPHHRRIAHDVTVCHLLQKIVELSLLELSLADQQKCVPLALPVAHLRRQRVHVAIERAEPLAERARAAPVPNTRQVAL